MYINMSDYTYSFSTSTSNTYSWTPNGYPVWGNTTSSSAAYSPHITIDSNGLWINGSMAWNFVMDADGNMHSAKEWEMESVSAEELDDVLEEVS
jgi:hypothetical protein